MHTKQNVFKAEENKQFPPLQENITCDYLVVGGGLAGILCAYYLANSGKDVVLVEKNKIGQGVTYNSTACITILNDGGYQDLVKDFNEDVVKEYIRYLNLSLKEYQKLSKKFEFDYKQLPGYIYSLDEKWIKKEVETLNKLKISFSLEDNPLLPFKTKGAIKIENQAEMNVVKLISELSKQLKIFEQTKVIDIKENIAYCENNVQIKFKKAVIATHFPIFNRRGLFFMKMHQQRSYVVIIKGNNVKGTYISSKAGELYFRNYGEYLLIGGNDKRTGKTKNMPQELLKMVNEYYPNSEIVGIFANQDCLTLDGMPYVGKYSKKWNDVYVITGFNMSGMTNALAGTLYLMDLFEGKKVNKDLFNPQRKMKILPLLNNLGATLVNFVYPTTRRCTHLGCGLHYNEKEKTFDCPCHGSRYSLDGKVIENPAQKNKKCPLKKEH